MWSRSAQWEGRSIGVGDPTEGVLRPRKGHGTVSLFHPPHGASREMQMTRLSPLCCGDKDLSCRFHNSSTVYIHHGRRLTQIVSEMILFFPCVVSVIIASGAERKMSMNRMCACLLWCRLWRPKKKGGKKRIQMLAVSQQTKRECAGGDSPGRVGVVGIDQGCVCV